MSIPRIVVPLSDEDLYRQACDEKYVSRVAVRSPCLSRPMEWFTRHKKALLVLAQELVSKGNVVVTFSGRVKNLLFERVINQYCASVKSGALYLRITQGCCQSNNKCVLIAFQRALLVAIRTKVRDEENVWPHDL